MEIITSTSSGAHLLLLSSNRTTNTIRANSTPPKASSSPLPPSENIKDKIEIRVCTNRTCRKQGSLDVFQLLTGISPPSVTVKSCGCLARCGSGPNIVILPEGVLVGHCGTPRKAAEVMAAVCGIEDEGDVATKCLEALALRKIAEDEAGRADFAKACDLLSQAIHLKPFGGLHILYKDRSAARLAMGDINGALEDSKEAMNLAPHYPEAYLCEGDVFFAMEQFDGAEESFSIALDLDPSIRRSKSFKTRIAKLREKLAPASMS
ncbi:tetratricopeptide repeat (TPR)-containing protein [Striga hermonthica]|uniref:Tetratricopeptide repeat (TPR)-containing protein n=1 Tax=Striga hermonthica TaxID=68872 RepID=A0A9N7RGH7_STRHE|nr:tetratricopeptide repeat (TPR)-containing protein [Striga hermonthica]